MAKKSIITYNGLQLLGTSAKVSGQYYWLGYYALAYVPNAWKSSSPSLPPCSPDGFDVEDLPSEPLSYNMTKLTESGDIIYNIFQGDLVGTGYYDNKSDGTAGGNLFGMSMYDQSIKKHYRYVLDEFGNNNLVAWEEDTGNLMLGATIYNGTDGFNESDLPIPAPLYYLGDVTGKLSKTDFFPDIANSSHKTNGADIYSSIEVTYDGGNQMEFPKISADYRNYLDSQYNDDTASYAYSTEGAEFDTREIASAVDVGFDENSWFTSNSTRLNESGLYEETVCKSLWKVLSISNYNRASAPASSLGSLVPSDIASRNIGKITKFFPISNYKVINSVTGFTSEEEYREVATSIAITVDVDLTPKTKASGGDNGEIPTYDENALLGLFDKYDRSDDLTQDPIYNTTHTSFKFNRVGIYAIPLMGAPYTLKKNGDESIAGTECDVQFQVDPDKDPVLFAVFDFDNTVYLSDTGDGLHRFRANFNLNLAADTDLVALDSQLIRDTVIFYNMYEDDAQKWYQNQLIATASTQNAIMEFGLELQHLKQKLNELVCCPPPNFDNKYAPKNHTHTGYGLRNLKDALNAVDGGLRGVDTIQDGHVDSEILDPYFVGLNSLSVGWQTIAQADYSIVGGYNCRVFGGEESLSYQGKQSLKFKSIYSTILGGINNTIYNSEKSFIGIGNELQIDGYMAFMQGNIIVAGGESYIRNSSHSSILNSRQSTIYEATRGLILVGDESHISQSNYCTILNAQDASITFESHQSFIGTGSGHSIQQSENSGILAGISNSVFYSDKSMIFMGEESTIGDESNPDNHSDSSTILNATQSYIKNGSSNIILFGFLSYINKSTKSILSGSTTYINNSDRAYAIGDSIRVLNSQHSTANGYLHYILYTSYSGIYSGNNGTIRYGQNSAILSGVSNNILGDGQHNIINSAILGGALNTIETIPDGRLSPSHSVILGGNSTVVNHYGEVAHSNAYIHIANPNFGIRNPNPPNEYTTFNSPVTVKQQHSVFNLTGVMDLYETDNTEFQTVDNLLAPTTFTQFPMKTLFLTLDGNAIEVSVAGSQNILKNSINLKNGESMSGTVKLAVHFPYTILSSPLCAELSSLIFPSGFTYYSLISFGAHRDAYGKLTVNSQLINDSVASVAMGGHNQDYSDLNPFNLGISSNIIGFNELYPGNDIYGIGYRRINDDIGNVNVAYRIDQADGHNDAVDLNGSTGGLLIQVKINSFNDDRNGAIYRYLGSRYSFASAVVDAVSINVGTSLFPAHPVPPIP